MTASTRRVSRWRGHRTASSPIGITCGDPAGIGPEVAVRAAEACRHKCVLIGPRAVFGRTRLEVWDVPGRRVTLGKPSREGGRIALAAIDRGVDACLRGELAALVTAPVSKTSLHAAGADVLGQTEYLAQRTAARDVRMMLAGPTLRVVLVSTHVALRKAIDTLTTAKVVQTAKTAHASLTQWLGKAPRLGLCALNPHAGEGGLFGDEERHILVPAVRQAKRAGISLDGPHPADTLFWHARHGRYDAVIVLFHDQGLIPLKLLHFDEGVNVSLGLPIIRTSPDHGTAYDIAGQGKADITSMSAAIKWAYSAAKIRARDARGSAVRTHRRRQPGSGSPRTS